MAGSRKADIIGAYIAFGILVVFAIVYSLLSRPRGTATSNSVCISNERQIGLALLQYSQDFDHQLPSGIDQNGAGWAGETYPYVKSTDIASVFKCPDDPTTASAPNDTISYGYNLNIARRLGKIKEGDPRAVVMLFEIAGDQAELDKKDEGNSQGAKTFSAAGDGTDGSLSGGYAPNLQYATGILGKRPALPDGSQFSAADGRHKKGANYLMADGHSHWNLPSKISSGLDAENAKDYQTGTITGRAAGTGNGDFIATFSTR